jgi:putative intracellular protease/amidase
MTEYCQSIEEEDSMGTRSGKPTETRTVHVAVYDTLADWEVGFAVAGINNGEWQRYPGGHRVVTVGETGEPVTTTGGVRILPDMTLADLRPSDSAMLVLPGGATWDAGGNVAFVDAARAFLDAGVPVAAICGATSGLAAGGLLDDRPHTSNAPEYLAAVDYGGAAHYRSEPAVADGDLITASGVHPVEFARAVFDRLDLYEPGVLDAWYRLYGEHDPAGFYELAASESPA